MKYCPFCELISAHASSWHRSWLHEVAFTPLNPVAPGHLLVVPREHVADAAEHPVTTASVFRAAAELAQEAGPCNLITSCGVEATQTIRHLHVHVVPRRPGDGLALPWSR